VVWVKVFYKSKCFEKSQFYKINEELSEVKMATMYVTYSL